MAFRRTGFALSDLTISYGPSGDNTVVIDDQFDQVSERVEHLSFADGSRYTWNGSAFLRSGGGDPPTGGGTPGNDRRSLTDGDDRFDALGGNDRIKGRLGNDALLGDTGNDYLDGGAGLDVLIGGAGDDRLTGGSGRDQARYNQVSASYDMTKLGGGRYEVASAFGTDTVSGVEQLVFTDRAVTLPG